MPDRNHPKSSVLYLSQPRPSRKTVSPLNPLVDPLDPPESLRQASKQPHLVVYKMRSLKLSLPDTECITLGLYNTYLRLYLHREPTRPSVTKDNNRCEHYERSIVLTVHSNSARA